MKLKNKKSWESYANHDRKNKGKVCAFEITPQVSYMKLMHLAQRTVLAKGLRK